MTQIRKRNVTVRLTPQTVQKARGPRSQGLDFDPAIFWLRGPWPFALFIEVNLTVTIAFRFGSYYPNIDL